MRALTYHGSLGAIAICGSDLHRYRGKIPAMKRGDIFGHEFMGEVVDAGPLVSHRLRLGQTAEGYKMCDKKGDDCRKVVLTPWGRIGIA